jgi:alkylation response protein AidB-like acyl-CoA dehydrogenase
MRIANSQEALELAAVLRDALEPYDAVSSPSTAERTGFDEALTSVLVSELGLLEVAATGEDDPVATMVRVCVELGRALASAPVIPSLLAVQALAEGADDARDAVLPRLLEDGATAAIAVPVGAAEPVLAAKRSGDGWRVSGESGLVLFGDAADVFIASSGVGAETILLAIPRDAATVSSRALPALDQTRQIASVRFDGAVAHVVAGPQEAAAAVTRLIDRGAVLFAAEALGVAERCLEATLEHVKTRHQFGRAVGSFQAIKHRLADRYAEIDAARSLLTLAAAVADDPSAPPSERSLTAGSALVYANDASYAMAAETIQLHGGMGFTWEHFAHLYFKRAQAARSAWGTQAFHRERVLGSVESSLELLRGGDGI